ncbi:MAG: hypothetical protein IPL23_15600 [Saprospiraceae bacterium]|nr:hypothetical protein [Saprospiraceae bacterium]
MGTLYLSFFEVEQNEKKIAQNVIKALGAKDEHWDLKSNITSSQWGNIRAKATDFIKNNKSYNDFLLELGYVPNENGRMKINKTGMLTHGTMFDKLWDKNARLEKFKTILDNHAQHSLVFVANILLKWRNCTLILNLEKSK